MYYSLLFLVAAIMMIAGFMVANVFAYLEFNYSGVYRTKILFFRRLGFFVVLLSSLIFSLYTPWLLEGLRPITDSFSILNLAIVLTKSMLVVSSSLLGYILTFNVINSFERS